MRSVLPVLLLGVAGLLVGGTWSLRKQGSSPVLVIGCGLLAVLALAGGIAWLLPKGVW